MLRLPSTDLKNNVISLASCGTLVDAAAAMARLDQALAGTPLLPAIIYRARLDAVRNMAAAGGRLIDPWQLAAMLEGVRLRMPGELSIAERGLIFDAARHALGYYQWLQLPDSVQQEEISRAAAALAAADRTGGTLLAAARSIFSWIDAGGSRSAIWAALGRYWQEQKILLTPLPITGAAALRAGTLWRFEDWLPVFLVAITGEAEATLNMFRTLDRDWRAARACLLGRRRNSKLPLAADLLAASPVLSASSLASLLGIAIKNASQILEELVTAGVAVELSHREKRRLYALQGMTPLRDAAAPPKRPLPGRSRGRPRHLTPSPLPAPESPHALPRALPAMNFDYGELDEALAGLDVIVLKTRLVLDGIGTPPRRGAAPEE